MKKIFITICWILILLLSSSRYIYAQVSFSFQDFGGFDPAFPSNNPIFNVGGVAPISNLGPYALVYANSTSTTILTNGANTLSFGPLLGFSSQQANLILINTNTGAPLLSYSIQPIVGYASIKDVEVGQNYYYYTAEINTSSGNIAPGIPGTYPIQNYLAAVALSGQISFVLPVTAPSTNQNGSATITGIAVDGLDNVYVYGTYLGSIDFDPLAIGLDVRTATGIDTFVSSYTSSGFRQWTLTYGGGSNTNPIKGIIEATGDLILVSQINLFGTANTISPGFTISGQVTSGLDILVSRINPAGNLVNANVITTPMNDQPTDIIPQSFGYVIALNSDSPTIDLDFTPGQQIASTFNKIGNQDGYIALYTFTDTFGSGFQLGAANNFTSVDSISSNNCNELWAMSSHNNGSSSAVPTNVVFDKFDLSSFNITFHADVSSPYVIASYPREIRQLNPNSGQQIFASMIIVSTLPGVESAIFGLTDASCP